MVTDEYLARKLLAIRSDIFKLNSTATVDKPLTPWAVMELLLCVVEYLQGKEHLESARAAETPSSSPVIERQEGQPSTNSTFSDPSFHVKVVPTGAPLTTVTVTFHAPNFTPTLGDVRKSLLAALSTVDDLMTLGLPLPSGSTLSDPPTPEPQAAGPIAGGSDSINDFNPSKTGRFDGES